MTFRLCIPSKNTAAIPGSGTIYDRPLSAKLPWGDFDSVVARASTDFEPIDQITGDLEQETR